MMYVERTKTVEAIQWDGDNLDEIQAVLPATHTASFKDDPDTLLISNTDGLPYYTLLLNDYLVKLSAAYIKGLTEEEFDRQYQPADQDRAEPLQSLPFPDGIEVKDGNVSKKQ